MEEEAVDLDKEWADLDYANVLIVDIQSHIHVEHHVLLCPAQNVVQD